MLKNAVGTTLNWLKSVIRPAEEGEPEVFMDTVRVVSSRLDAEWYLARYPEVAGSNLSPGLHYVLTGADAGYDPAPDFSTLKYIQAYPDVRQSSMNPYYHWIRYGRAEGRLGGGSGATDPLIAAEAAKTGQPNVMFTVFVDCTGNPLGSVAASLKSLDQQTYRNFEVILLGQVQFDGWGDLCLSSRGVFFEPLLNRTAIFAEGNPARLRGDYVLLLEAGDEFAAQALSILNRSTDIGSAEERIDLLIFDYLFGDRRERQYLPGFDLDLLAATDYLQSALAVSRELLRRRGNDHEPNFRRLLLSAADKGLSFRHVPEAILQTARRPAAPGFNPPQVTPGHGVSIIIPNRNRPDLLKKCTGFLPRLGLPYELIIIDNGSDDPAVEELYRTLREELGARILRVRHEFNYSRMVNAGVQASGQEFLLLLNNDVLIEDATAVRTAIAYAAQETVGVVGSVLRYPDGGVQHAGMVFWTDPDGALRSDHILRHATGDDPHCLGALTAPRTWRAVTGAFQVLRKSVFDEVGGYDDCNLPVEYNDVDFCFRVGALGLRVVCLPLPGITHDESSTRKSLDAAQNERMLEAAQAVMRARWGAEFGNDPFFHPEIRRSMGLKPAVSEPDGAPWHWSGRPHGAKAPTGAPREVRRPPTEVTEWFPRRLSPGLCVVGFLSSEIGLGEAARNLGRASDAARIPTSYVNRYLPQRSNDPRFGTFLQPRADRRATVSVEGLKLDGYDFNDKGQGRLQILYPFWELPHVPRGAYAMLDKYDELWAASEFIATALRETNRRPVRLIPQPVVIPEVPPAPREPRDKIRFLTYFDYDSYIARKNPLAAVAAFRAAFPRRDDVELVVKARGLDENDARRTVSDAVGQDPRIRLLDATMSREEMNALMREADVFVSLHRSEGFGFGAAEALAAGRAVIATGWSATNDFVTHETGYLVDYRLRAVKKKEYIYSSGQVWAEPDVEAAVTQFRLVADDPITAAARARKGRELLLRRNSFAAVGAEMASALAELGAV